MESDKSIYPELTIEKIKNPNRYWAFPILGGLVKIIILIPVFIEFAALAVYLFFLGIVNSFYVLFRRQYWRYCYDINCGVINLYTKTSLFFSGLSNDYPGFNLKPNNDFSIKLDYPVKPRVFFAIPVIGALARVVLLIPFIIYSEVISNGAKVGVVGSSVPVLLKGRYPDSTFELARDSLRLNFSAWLYFAGISDKYPSFKISMNHQTVKIFLIIIGTLLLLLQFGDRKERFKERFNEKPHMQNAPNNYTPSYQNYR